MTLSTTKDPGEGNRLLNFLKYSPERYTIYQPYTIRILLEQGKENSFSIDEKKITDKLNSLLFHDKLSPSEFRSNLLSLTKTKKYTWYTDLVIFDDTNDPPVWKLNSEEFDESQIEEILKECNKEIAKFHVKILTKKNLTPKIFFIRAGDDTSTNLTWLSIASQVLIETSDHRLEYHNLGKKATEKELKQTDAESPEETIARDIRKHIERFGEDSFFTRPESATYGLKESMTFKQAIELVLFAYGKPMKSSEISKIIVENNLKNTDGQTPERTISTELIRDVENGENSTFVKIDENKYSLRAQNQNISDGIDSWYNEFLENIQDSQSSLDWETAGIDYGENANFDLTTKSDDEIDNLPNAKQLKYIKNIKKGDIVVIKKNNIDGIINTGIVTKEYYFDEDVTSYHHRIGVKYLNISIPQIKDGDITKIYRTDKYADEILEHLRGSQEQTEYFLLRYNGNDSIPKTQEQWRDVLGEQYHFGQGVDNQKAIREAGIGTKTIWYKTKNLPGFYFWGFGSVKEIRTNQDDRDWNLLYSDFKYFEQGNDSIEEQEVFLQRSNESIEEQIKTLPGYNQTNSIIKITKKIYEEITGDIISVSSSKIPFETNNKFFNILNKKKQFFFYGPPGTGKTFTAKKIAREFIKESQTKFFTDEQYNEYVLSMINRVSHEKGFELKKQTDNQIILKNSQKEIRIYLNYSKSGKQTPHDCYVGISQSVIDFLNQTDDENRFVLILNNDVKNFVLIPHQFIIKNVKLSGGENWNSDGNGDHSFHIHVYDEKSQFRANDDYSENYVDCSDFLSNIEILFNSHGKSCNKLEKVTFHQSFSYEEFIEGIRPKTDDKINQVTYPIEDGIFKRLSKCASLHNKENFVLIIDEINRGNISKIFGELITLLENDKRGDEVTLPYSKKLFSVPKNLYIIGTMNTADRSLVHIDAALKRRFGQYELMPDYSLLNSKIDKIHLGTLLENINQKIIKAGFRDNQIGHSYFMTDKNPITTREELQFAFAYDIVPLLKDNFYDDDKILKDILGDEFIDANRDTISEWMEDVSEFMKALESAYPEAIE